jgi:hypothetical protein
MGYPEIVSPDQSRICGTVSLPGCSGLLSKYAFYLIQSPRLQKENLR